MTNPKLYVIAGCNGSGKSSFSNALTPNGINPFDYDKEFLKIYWAMRDSELRTRIAHNRTRELLEQSTQRTIQERKDFCYETNFNSTPLYWPNIFKAKGFELTLFFFCLDSIEKAKKRVRIRVENGGHFVPNQQIEERFLLGYKYLNMHFDKFDFVHLMDASQYKKEPAHFMSIYQKEIYQTGNFPLFLKQYTPKICQLISSP